MGPNVCLPQELFQETLDSLHYALRMQESLEYRLPTKQQQAEFQEDLVMLLEKLEGYRQKGETGEASSSKVGHLGYRPGGGSKSLWKHLGTSLRS